MSYVQVRKPDTSLKEYAGYCHRLIRRVYGAPAVEPSAWQAWLRAKGRHTGAHPKNVSVPIWFSHYGTYGGVYGNFGHVVAYVPGRGYMSSPHSGYGVLWFSTIAAVERAFNAKYVGWTTDISTVTVVRYSPTPPPAPQIQKGSREMYLIMYRDAAGKNKPRWLVFGSPKGLVLSSPANADRWIKAMGRPAIVCPSESAWKTYLKAARP